MTLPYLLQAAALWPIYNGKPATREGTNQTAYRVMQEVIKRSS